MTEPLDTGHLVVCATSQLQCSVNFGDRCCYSLRDDEIVEFFLNDFPFGKWLAAILRPCTSSKKFWAYASKSRLVGVED